MEEIRIMVDHEAFLMGIKPALCRRMIPQLEELMPQLEKYPYMIDDDGTYLFFQNQELMDNYLAALSNIVWGSPEYHRLLGLTLGYPPKAVEFFLDKLTDHSLYQCSVNVGYAGYRFVVHVNDLHDIIVNMWNQHEVEEETRLGVDSELFYIGFRDYEELHKVVTEVRRALVEKIPIAAGN